MHLIDGVYRGANALSAADVNGNGVDDYVSIYEFDQRYRVALHPGPGADARSKWQTIDVWSPPRKDQSLGVNPESAVLVDVDGDGHLDVVGAQGQSDLAFWEGDSPGVRVFFGPPAEQVGRMPFLDAGRVPGTTSDGHLHWVSKLDVDGNGVENVVVGGRVGNRGTRAGIFWLELPSDESLRRDLSSWRIHHIDPDTPSGHGFTLVDVDGDGHVDLVNANNDFDTRRSEQSVVWYRNPGPQSPLLREPWERHVVVQEPIFHTKPQVAAGDLNGNGRTDLAVQTNRTVEVFVNQGGSPPSFERVSVPKPREIAGFRSRTLRMGDMNGDGRADLVGFLVHEDASLPSSRMSVYWMQWNGDEVTTDWSFHPIRWGPGRTMLIPEFGEKWDQVFLVDVDGDGDLDIVANNEEWWTSPKGEWWPWFDDPRPQSQAVVWFENTLDEEPLVTTEADGMAVVEAEIPTLARDGVWVSRNLYPGFSGTGYLQAFNGLNPSADLDLPALDILSGVVGRTSSPGVRFDVELSGGRYQLWLRRWVPQQWGYGMGGTLSNSAWLSINGGRPVVVDDDASLPNESWQWVRVADPVELPAGRHEITLRVRERGYAVDQLVLTRIPADPAGLSVLPGR